MLDVKLHKASSELKFITASCNGDIIDDNLFARLLSPKMQGGCLFNRLLIKFSILIRPELITHYGLGNRSNLQPGVNNQTLKDLRNEDIGTHEASKLKAFDSITLASSFFVS
jgi:hypothetical protein